MGDDDIYRQAVKQRTPLNHALCAIWYRLWELTGFSSTGGSGGIAIAQAKGTYVYFHVANGQTLAGGIPQAAKRWGVNFIGSGTTNTFGTNTALTGGQGFSDNASPVSAIAIVCDGSTVADGFYSTT